MAAASGREAPAAESLVAESPAMRAVAEQIRQAAGAGGILITGEPGTGRTLVAHLIHEQACSGDRDSGRFVIEDCARDARDVERTLFGSAHGGPRRERTTLERISRGSAVYLARGGTLLLEHVADLPSRSQTRLVRLLRDQEAELLEEPGTTLDMRLRVIARAGTDIAAAVEDGHLNRDLYDRLSQRRIAVPPLRQRREDIPALAVHCLQRACEQHQVPVKTIRWAAMKVLTALPWPGNVPQLAGCMDVLARTVTRSSIYLEDVLDRITFETAVLQMDDGVTLRAAREQFERDRIAAALARHHGRVGEAAKALGIERTNLYRKVRALKLPRPGARRQEPS
jgi:DNA-binding NtrC family response regulator